MKLFHRLMSSLATAASAALIGIVFALPVTVSATPYASGVTDAGGTVSFYINESGGNVVITFEDGSTNASFNGITTGVNVLSGKYSFSLGSHSTYVISVTKTGTGVAGIEPNVIQNTNTSVNYTCLFGLGDPRGLAVNVNATSPYFGRIYVSRGGASAGTALLYDLNSDGSFSTAGSAGSAAGVAWSIGSPYSSPDRISLAANDFVVVGDWSSANAGVWLVDPNLTTNELILGPVGEANGKSAGVHGAEVSRPVLLGNLATGANLLVVDSDLTTPNSLLVYSNLTSSALPWENAPSLIGPEVAINYASYPGQSVYLFPSLFVGPSGYIYSGEYRGGPSSSNPPGVQVYDTSVTNLLWNSGYSGGTKDYFNTTASGGSACLPTDLAVSPDGKYLAAVGVDSHLTICSLTNGIPDVSTIYTVKPLQFTGEISDGANEVGWDAGDNLYVLSAGSYGLTTWTLGYSTVAATTGTATGTTAFGLTFLNTQINVYATNNPIISQANSYGHPTSGSFTLVRSGGNLSLPLTLNFTYGGTATNGTYTSGSAGTVVFAPSQTTTNILIAAVTDSNPRLTTYLTLTATPSTQYSVVGAGQATISIENTATPYLVASAGAPTMYNAFSNDYASVVITRLGDTNTTLTVSDFTYGGTAVKGTDYTTPTPVTFNPGDLTQASYIFPLIGGQLPVHSATLPYTGNKTATLGVGTGTGYNPAVSTASLAIVDSATPPAPVLYADPLTDPNDATNWNITAANGDLLDTPPDVEVAFGYNLTSGDFPIPFPPNGSQYALRMTVNKLDGQGGTSPMTAVNAYLTNNAFSGNYAVRFNMNVIETGNLVESGSFNNEEGPLMGINHDGLETNWFGPDAFTLGAPEVFAGDGLFYWVSDSGGRYDDISGYGVYPYRAFTGNGSPATNGGFAIIGGLTTAPFANAFKTNVFTTASSTFLPPHDGGWTEGGPGLPANGSGNYGLSVQSWSDVEIRQIDGIVTLSIDKTPIFTTTNLTMFTSGFLMLGYEDPWNGGEDADTAAYFSNLRVVAIGGPVINSITADNVHDTMIIDFTITEDDSNAFSIYSSSTVAGPYANVSAAMITSLGGGIYQAVVPQSGATQFYRILQQ
jgi:hypothetical protein